MQAEIKGLSKWTNSETGGKCCAIFDTKNSPATVANTEENTRGTPTTCDSQTPPACTFGDGDGFWKFAAQLWYYPSDADGLCIEGNTIDIGGQTTRTMKPT